MGFTPVAFLLGVRPCFSVDLLNGGPPPRSGMSSRRFEESTLNII